MKTISLDTCLKKMEVYAKEFRKKVVIYPTDTVYGIGCDATNDTLVSRIFEIKKRDKNKPMSVIAPSFDWIWNNLVVDEGKKQVIMDHLPGPYTILLRKKRRPFLELATANKESVGVRIPAHPIAKVVRLAGIPFVTTSANLSGEKHASRIDEIDKEVMDKVDLIIDGGKLKGTPSTIIDLTSRHIRVIHRS